MTVIVQFDLDIVASQVIALPADAVILDAQFRYRRLVLWAQLDPDAPRVDRTIHVYGRGVALPSPAGRHIATVQQFNGSEVWHVFEMAPT